MVNSQYRIGSKYDIVIIMISTLGVIITSPLWKSIEREIIITIIRILSWCCKTKCFVIVTKLENKEVCYS